MFKSTISLQKAIRPPNEKPLRKWQYETRVNHSKFRHWHKYAKFLTWQGDTRNLGKGRL